MRLPRTPSGLTPAAIERALRAQLKDALAAQPPEVAGAIADPANQKTLDRFFSTFSELSARRVNCDSSTEQIAELVTAAQAYLAAVQAIQAGVLAALLGIDPASITDAGE